jgi:hypothetical protein
LGEIIECSVVMGWIKHPTLRALLMLGWPGA